MERLQEILALLENPDAISDEELAALESELQEIYTEIREGDELEPEDIETLGNIVDAVDGIRFLAGERLAEAERAAAEEAERAAERAARLEELDSRVQPADEVDDDDESDDEGDGAPPELEIVSSDETDDDESDDEDNADEGEDEVRGKRAASTTPRSAIRQRAGKRYAARPRRHKPRISIRAAGGGQFNDLVDVENGLIERLADLQGTDQVGRSRVATFQMEYPSERTFAAGRTTDVQDLVDELHAAVRRPDGNGIDELIADGALCVPVEVKYDLTTLATAGRPLRGTLATYNTRRGGVRWYSPLSLSDVHTTGGSPNQAIGAMTMTQWEADALKTYERVDCGEESEVLVEAVWRQLEFNNFMARTNPERTAQFTELSIAKFAQYTEQRLMTKMKAATGVINVTAPQQLGAIRDYLTMLNQTAIKWRLAERTAPTFRLQAVIPYWVGAGLLPDDNVRALQSYPEQFDTNIADVERWLRARGIDPIWFWDEWTDAFTTGQNIPDYPATFDTLIFHPGSYALVDNGTLDIGIHRDADLINANRFRTFTEEFWNVAMWGINPLKLTTSLCANGASAGSVAPTCGS